MLAVIAIPEFDAAASAWIDALRRAHDPQQDRVGPHMMLMCPASIADEAAFRRQLETMAAETAAFDVVFDRLDRLDDPQQPKYRHLNVLLADAASATKLTELHRALTGSTGACTPHLTLSRFAAAYSAKALDRQLGGLGDPMIGRIGTFELLRIRNGMIRSEECFLLAG